MNTMKRLKSILEAQGIGKPYEEKTPEQQKRADEIKRDHQQRQEMERRQEQLKFRRLMDACDVATAGRYFSDFTTAQPWQNEFLGVCTNFADLVIQGGQGANLVLAGGYGTGKTHLGAAILNHCHAEAGRTFLARQFEGLIVELWGRNTYADDRRRLESLLLNVDCLLIDEVGASETQLSEQRQSELGRLIRARTNKKRATIITTNHNYDDFAQAVGSYVIGGLEGNKGETVYQFIQIAKDLDYNQRDAASFKYLD